MSKREKIHELFDLIAYEVYLFIKENEPKFTDGWVPAKHIKIELDLNKSAYPKSNQIDNKTGWLFSTIARHLEDNGKVKFKKLGQRSFYKTCI